MVLVLFFRCSALATPPEDPPAKQLHMTYKIFQTDTKLVTLLLQSHGLVEVSVIHLYIYCAQAHVNSQNGKTNNSTNKLPTSR